MVQLFKIVFFLLRYSETALWTIPDVSSRDTGEYKCIVISAAGNDSATTIVETKGIHNFDFVQFRNSPRKI